MDPVSASAGGSSAGLAGLRIWSSSKKKAHVNSMYSRDPSFKKPKMPVAGEVVDSSAGPLSLKNIGGASINPVVSWGSKVGSVFSSVSSLSDVENMENMVTEETSYAESGKDNNMDEVTPKKICT